MGGGQGGRGEEGEEGQGGSRGVQGLLARRAALIPCQQQSLMPLPHHWQTRLLLGPFSLSAPRLGRGQEEGSLMHGFPLSAPLCPEDGSA